MIFFTTSRQGAGGSKGNRIGRKRAQLPECQCSTDGRRRWARGFVLELGRQERAAECASFCRSLAQFCTDDSYAWGGGGVTAPGVRGLCDAVW